jgi:triacylglycerol lipase
MPATKDTKLDDLTNPGAANDFFTRRALPPFEPDATSFSVANALWLIELSRLVYRRSNIVPPRTSFLRQAELEEVRFFDEPRTDTQAMLVRSTRDPKWAALVFRGTERRFKDIITDLNTISVRVSGNVRVHEGFELAIEAVWPQIAPVLATINVPLFFTGHSLGAALATLAATRLAPRAVYTFGSPRVGNAEFAKTLKDVPIFRVVDDTDEVTHLPPPVFGFSHVGNLHQLTENPQPPLRLLLEKKALDHAPVNYVDRLV